jgi:hypothetical protein
MTKISLFFYKFDKKVKKITKLEELKLVTEKQISNNSCAFSTTSLSTSSIGIMSRKWTR